MKTIVTHLNPDLDAMAAIWLIRRFLPGWSKARVEFVPAGETFEGKPVAIMSASTGMLGGARAQYHLRQSFVFLDMHPLNRPEVIVTFAGQKFDEQGRLTDETAKDLIKKLLDGLVAWTKKLKAG